MLNIAICDDDELSCEIVNQMLIKYQKECGVEFDIDIYNSGLRLCKSLELGEKYSIIFLDINMPEINGIEVGRFLREVLNDMYTSLVYVSSEEDYALKLFENMPIGFFIKPINYEDVKSKIDKIIERYGQLSKNFEYYISKKKYYEDLNNILYFESSGRKIIMVTHTEKIEFYERLSDIYERINSDNFKFVHRSFLVNLKRVLNYDYTQLTMDNMDSIIISQSKRPEIREYYINKVLT